MIKLSNSIEFLSSDGVKLYGTFDPAQGEARGAALFVHGITADRDEWGLFERISKSLQTLGISSFRFDYRCHGKSIVSNEKFLLSGIERDINAANKILNSRIAFDVSKKYIFGSSFGGGVSYKSASLDGDFSRAFLLAPVFNYEEDIKKSAPSWLEDLNRSGFIQYASLQLSPRILQEAEGFDPFHFDDVLPATIYHGDQDGDVPLSSSQNIVSKHSSMQLKIVKGAGHVISARDDIDMETEETWALVDSVIDDITKEIEFDLNN